MRIVSCSEAAIDNKNSGEAAMDYPCIYQDSRSCGKKFVFFYDDSFLSLTKKSGFEILVARKMKEMRINEKYHSLIVDSLEIGIPVIIVTIAVFLFSPRK